MDILFRKFIPSDDGIVYLFEALKEHDIPENHFEFEDDVDFAYTNGDAGWFCAKVTAYKGGEIEGVDYLGGCSFRSFDDFLDPRNGYIKDMMNNAKEDLLNQIGE